MKNIFNFKELFDSRKKDIIGRNELVNIPEFGLYNIEAKIDSGAYRGAVHATEIKEDIDEDHKKVLKFKILDENHPEFKDITFFSNNFKKVKVKNSGMDFVERYAVPLMVELGGKKINCELTLCNRDSMRRPILIGRKAIKKHFIIDVNISNIRNNNK